MFTKKPVITKIHLLVHPFYGTLPFLFETVLPSDRDKIYYAYKSNVDPLRYAKTLARVWGQLILRIKNEPNSVLIVFPTDIGATRGKRLFDFAKKQLGDKIFFPETIENAIIQLKAIYKISPEVKIEAHGERSEFCVKSFAWFMARELHIPLQDNYFNWHLRTEDGRVVINPKTTETLQGKERYVKKHTQRLPKPKKTRPFKPK